MPPFFMANYIASLGLPPTQPPFGRHVVKNCYDRSMLVGAPSFKMRSCSKNAIVENA